MYYHDLGFQRGPEHPSTHGRGGDAPRGRSPRLPSLVQGARVQGAMHRRRSSCLHGRRSSCLHTRRISCSYGSAHLENKGGNEVRGDLPLCLTHMTQRKAWPKSARERESGPLVKIAQGQEGHNNSTRGTTRIVVCGDLQRSAGAKASGRRREHVFLG